jgi:hypothetical protein
MKHRFFILLFLLGLFAIVSLDPFTAEAQTYTIQNPLNCPGGTITCVIDAVTGFLIVIAAPLLTVMVLWAGFLFVTSGGDENKLKTAKNALLWAGIGFGVVLIARGLSAIIRQILGGGAP